MGGDKPAQIMGQADLCALHLSRGPSLELLHDLDALPDPCPSEGVAAAQKSSIRIDRDLSPALPHLMVDPQQMKQAVINIMKNAMEAMENGGTLSVKTCSLSETHEAAIEIGDTGPGISAKVMNNIFNPYYTTKHRGTGLGLPITNRIIKAHKGRIEIRSKDAGGALFTIKLPYPAP